MFKEHNDTTTPKREKRPTYYSLMKDFYTKNKGTTAGDIAKILAGDHEDVWKWDDRKAKVNKILEKESGKKFKQRDLTKLRKLFDIVQSQGYLEKRFTEKLEDTYSSLEQNYHKKRKERRSVVKAFAGTVAASLLFATVLGAYNVKPVKPHVPIKPRAEAAVEYIEYATHQYKIKKGDTLWALAKKEVNFYVKTCEKLKPILFVESNITDKTIYDTTNFIAGMNGKGNMEDYALKDKDPRNPHMIKPGETIVVKLNKVSDFLQENGYLKTTANWDYIEKEYGIKRPKSEEEIRYEEARERENNLKHITEVSHDFMGL